MVQGLAIDANGDLYVLNSSDDTLSKLRLLPPLAPEIAEVASELEWSVMGGDGGFDRPGRLAIAPDGTIWVMDNGHHRFQIFDADGTFIETWGSQGSDDGEFQFITTNGNGFSSIAFLEDGSFYVGDPANARVQKFGPDRSFEYSIGSFGSGPGQFQLPINVEIGPDGTLWVADDLRRDMQAFDLDGNLLSAFSAPEGSAWSSDFVVLENGNFLIGNTVSPGEPGQWFRIIELAPDGTMVRAFGGTDAQTSVFRSQPTDIAVDAEGRIFVGTAPEHGREIFVFSADGALLGSLPSSDFAAGIALDGAGHLYASGYLDGVLDKYRLLPPLAPEIADGAPDLLWATPGGDGGLAQAGRVMFAPDGTIWVADNDNHRFRIFVTDGTFIESWGEQGKGDGQFQFRVQSGDGFGKVEFAPDGSFFVLDREYPDPEVRRRSAVRHSLWRLRQWRWAVRLAVRGGARCRWQDLGDRSGRRDVQRFERTAPSSDRSQSPMSMATKSAPTGFPLRPTERSGYPTGARSTTRSACCITPVTASCSAPSKHQRTLLGPGTIQLRLPLMRRDVSSSPQ